MEEIKATKVALVPVSLINTAYDVGAFVSDHNCTLLKRDRRRAFDNDSASSLTGAASALLRTTGVYFP